MTAEWERTLANIAVDHRFVSCKFCGGKGHNVKLCSTIKSIDKTVRTLPTIRKIWGAYKGSRKGSGKEAGAARACKKAMEESKGPALAELKKSNNGNSADLFTKM